MKKLRKILLVDDDYVNNYLNETILKDLAIAENISIEVDGQKALAHLLTHCEAKKGSCPELIILDHQMPIMDGLN